MKPELIAQLIAELYTELIAELIAELITHYMSVQGLSQVKTPFLTPISANSY